MILFIIGFVVGMVVDNKWAPRVKYQDGKITFEPNTKKTP